MSTQKMPWSLANIEDETCPSLFYEAGGDCCDENCNSGDPSGGGCEAD